MSNLARLQEFKSLLEDVARAEIALKVFEKRIEIENQAPVKPRIEASQYIIDNAGWLTDDEIEFLQQPNHSPKAVADRLDMSESTVKRMCEKGQLSYSKPNGRYRIESVSVMEYLDNAKTSTKT